MWPWGNGNVSFASSFESSKQVSNWEGGTYLSLIEQLDGDANRGSHDCGLCFENCGAAKRIMFVAEGRAGRSLVGILKFGVSVVMLLLACRVSAGVVFFRWPLGGFGGAVWGVVDEHRMDGLHSGSSGLFYFNSWGRNFLNI